MPELRSLHQGNPRRFQVLPQLHQRLDYIANLPESPSAPGRDLEPPFFVPVDQLLCGEQGYIFSELRLLSYMMEVLFALPSAQTERIWRMISTAERRPPVIEFAIAISLLILIVSLS